MRRALGEMNVDGVASTREFYLALLNDPGVAAGAYDTAYVEASLSAILARMAQNRG
jgi:acetyl-CoA carboxylase biotin carboxylase subunit